MALNFPNNPQLGDTFLNYTWDGDKWTLLNEADSFELYVAADDSTKIRIGSGESIKFIGSGGITTSSDLEGNITINAPVNITGNAVTVTDGVYTTGSYTNPSWITELAYSKITGTPPFITGTNRLSNLDVEVLLDSTGVLTFPNNTINTASNSNSLLSNQSSSLIWRNTSFAPSQDAQTSIVTSEGSASITLIKGILGGLSTSVTWGFSSSGTLTFPDDTVQTTAYTGNVPAGNLTGNTLASGVTASSLTSLGILTGLTTSGAASITYTPGIAGTGVAVQVSGKDTTGGTGYFDFLRVTNTTSGATNPNKSFRLNSTGSIEIINSAYNNNLFTLTDAGALTVASSISIAGKQAVNGPAFSAYASNATLQTVTSGTLTKVLFQLEEFDTNSNYANSRFTPTIEGYYQLNAMVRIDGTTGTGEMYIALYKNGSTYKRSWNQSGVQIASNFWTMDISTVVYANGSTDYFEIYVQQTSGGNRTVTAVNDPAITWFNGCMLRGA